MQKYNCLFRKYISKKTVFTFLVLSLFVTGCTEEKDINPKLNTLLTTDEDISSTTAILKGEILITGNKNITEYGIEISKNVYFSDSETKGYQTSPSTGIFQVEFTNLEPVTTYYYKAYVLINTARVYSLNYEQFITKQVVKGIKVIILK